MTHKQRWEQNNWALGVVTKEEDQKFFHQMYKLEIKSTKSTKLDSVSMENIK